MLTPGSVPERPCRVQGLKPGVVCIHKVGALSLAPQGKLPEQGKLLFRGQGQKDPTGVAYVTLTRLEELERELGSPLWGVLSGSEARVSFSMGMSLCIKWRCRGG